MFVWAEQTLNIFFKILTFELLHVLNVKRVLNMSDQYLAHRPVGENISCAGEL